MNLQPGKIFFDEQDNIYVADSESGNVQSPGWEMGIRIGNADSGWVSYFVLLPAGDPGSRKAMLLNLSPWTALVICTVVNPVHDNYRNT